MNNIPHVVDTGASVEDEKPVAWRVKSKDGTWLYYDEPLVGTEPLYTRSASEQKYSAAWWQGVNELAEAGGMIGVLREYISDLENGLESSIKLNKAQAERNK